MAESESKTRSTPKPITPGTSPLAREESGISFRPPEGEPDRQSDPTGPTGQTSPTGSAATTPNQSESAASFEIEWFDEERPPQSGHIFAEPPPEPPLQPFEILHEPKPESETTLLTRPIALAPPNRPAPATDRPGARPSLWIRAFWGLIPIILLVTGYGSVILTQGIQTPKGVGHAWDEAYYYLPSLRAADWLTEVMRGNRPFDRASIDSYWGKETHNEHPSVQKFLSGIALQAFSDPNKQLWAMRLPIAIIFGMTLTLIYWLGRRAWGPVPGLVAALLYATMPRVFGHAHFASMETPLIFMMLLVVFCFLRGLDSPFWAVLTGLTFGLLLATKINGFFLPIPLILWGHMYARRKYINNLFAMMFLGPLVFVAAWPWLWHDTAQRILDYLRFHAQHQLTALFFKGETWGYDNPNAPWFYPSVIVGVTLPITALVLVLWGMLRTLAALPRRPIGALYLLCALVMLGVASAPSTPRYDGERLFLPVFAFLALLGGTGAVGFILLVKWFLTRDKRPENARDRRVRHWVEAALCLVVLFDGGSAIVHYRPYFLSYFNPLVGGLNGAYRSRNFETTYWGEALNKPVIDQLNSLPAGTRVMPLAMHELCLNNLQLWGIINPEIKITSQPPADYHLLLMRKGLFRRPERALAETRQFPAVKQWDKDGVPMIALYQTGLPFEQFWRTLPPGSYRQ